MRIVAGLSALYLLGIVSLGQTLDLSGPQEMGWCEEALFTVSFTAGVQTASALVFTVSRPNAGFVYVTNSATITLHDGTIFFAEPTSSELDLSWDLDNLLGLPYELPPEETVTLEFALRTSCGTLSGTLGARVDYVEEATPRYLTDSQPIQILPGAVLIYKEPSILAAEVGDTVTWTIVVENTGLGPVYNVVITDVLGPGLAYVASFPPGDVNGQTIRWEIAQILPGESVELELQAQVVACTGLENKADVRFGCEDEICFDTAVHGGTATASVRLILTQPLLDWIPPNLQIPYCDQDGEEVTIPITNIGQGLAKNIRLYLDCRPLVVTEVGEGARYENGWFYLEAPLAPGETFNLTFTVAYPENWCTAVPSGTVICQTIYENVCGEPFRPPVKIGSFSTTYGSAGPPSLNVSLTGANEVYICTTQDYNLSVSFAGLDRCGNGATSDISVVVDVPEGFTVEDAGGGIWTPGPDGTGGTITWTIPPTAPLSTTLSLKAPGTPRCGEVATLTATATAEDCCGCAISATSSVPIAIECYQLVTSSHQATPLVQEKCGEIAYTHTYVFAEEENGPPISFRDLTFTAYPANAQDYVEDSLTLLIDESPAAPIQVIDNTPGGPLEIQGIDDDRPVWGHTLQISYRLRLTPDAAPLACPGSATFYAWTTLDLGPDCAMGDQCTEPCQVTEVLRLTSTTPSMSVAVTGLPDDFVDPCGTYNVTVTLTKTSVFDPHDVVLRLENLNYYIVDVNSIQVSGVQPANPVPTEYGTYYEWTYGEAFVGQAQGAQSVLTFEVRKRCGPGVELRAIALYKDACGGECSSTGSDAPLFLRSPYLFVYKTPETVYATQNLITWTIYVVNSGNGYAYEVWVDDEMGSGLEYVSSSVAPSTGVTTYPNQDHLGNPINGVSWRIAAMAPGEQRVITLVTRMVGCSELWNEVTAGLGCGGEECLPPVRDFSRVLVPTTQLVATSSTASPIATCTEQPALIRIRNTGDPTTYNLVVRESLPPGLTYVSGTTRWRKGAGAWTSGGDPTVSGDIWTGFTLEWTVNEIAGLSELRSRETLEIEFVFRASCNFEGGNFVVAVDYVNVCGEPRSLPVGTFRVEARRPSLAIQKTQISPSGNGPIDCGGEVTWRIDVTNTGPIPIPYVWVEDELGTGFTYVSSTGGDYGVDNGCPSGSKVTWALQNLPPGATAQLTLTARETGCGDLTNAVRAWWGCGQDGDGSSCTLDADCLAETFVFREVVATRTPNVSVSATLNPAQIPACGTTTMILEIQNPSSATASAVDVRIQLPAGLTYVPGTTEIDCGGGFVPGADPYELGGYLYWYDPDDPAENLCTSIPPGGTIRLRFGVQAACYRTTGSAAVRIYFYDCCLLGQQEFNTSFALAPAVPSLTISKTPATVPLDCFDPTSTVTWQIRVTNNGAASADWVRIEDTLGANLVYVGSNPPATSMGNQKWGWEFGPLGPGETRTVEITARLTQPANDCNAALRTNTAQAWWGCGTFDGDPNTVEGCTGGGPVTATARATIPDVYLNPADIVPILTCVGDGDYTGRVQITIRNAGDAPVTQDFRLTLSEATSGWSVSGLFAANFGGTLPIPAGGTRAITIPNWPVTCGQCTYTFTVTLDTENVLCECRENNNGATRVWTITLPDLTVRSATLSLVCAGEGQVRISGTVILGNEGCGSALTANVPMRFVLREGPGCAGNVLYTWTETFTGVNIPAKGEQTFTVSHTFSLNLCTSSPGCTVSLLIEADPMGSICECDGTNNTRCVDLPVNIPDLTVRGETLTLTCAGDGLVRISGTVTLGNEGCGSALTANIPMRFVLRDGPGCTGTVLYSWTETFTGVNIPAKGEQTFTVDHTFPLNLCTGSPGCVVSLLIEADHTNSICECDGTNNTRCVDLPFSIPDLWVTAVVPEVANACQPGTVQVTVENVGCGPSLAGVTVRVTGDATGETVLPAISPGGSAAVTITLNEVLPCGSYRITATADPDGELCECSSGNNSADVTFTVVDPDLTLTDLSILCQGDGSFAVAFMVRNIGTEASPATTVQLYIDGILAHTFSVPALPVGGSAPLSWLSPRLKCGVDHLFRLVVDEADAICECNAGNNEVQAHARCGCPALVTGKAITQILRAGVPVPPSSPVQPGDLITYTLTATNVGTGWAFDVDVWDELPVEFAYVSGSTSASWPGGSSMADPAGAPGPSLFWDLSATLLPGETLTLQFQAFVTSLARQGFSYTNAMGATGKEGDETQIPPDSGLPGDDDPDDQSTVLHPAEVPALALDKAIADVLRGGVSRGPAGPVEPGDVIVYTVTIRNVGYGVAYDVDFTDQLPPHVEYETAYGEGTWTVDKPAASGFLGIPDGATGTITADLSATINPGGTLLATYRVRVLSTASQGVDLVNTALATGKDGAGSPIPEYNPDVPDTFPDQDSTRIPVVEPGLALEKEIVDVLRGGVSIWPTPIVLWGDVIVYKVTVRNVGLGTAYDVDFTDTLPFGLAYDASEDGTYTVDNPPALGSLGIPDGATGTIKADISATIAGGGKLVAIYRARVTPEAIPGSWLTNAAAVTGKDGAGTPIPEFNPDVGDDYPDWDSTGIRLGAPALVTEKKYYCEPCDPCAQEPAPCPPCPKEPIEVRVGEIVRFQLTVTNVGYSTAYAIVVEDRLPKGFEYVKESAILTWPGGKVQLEPVIAESAVLTWVTGLALEAGESLTIVFAAQVKGEARSEGEVVNVMRAEGVDAFHMLIPADSRIYVPADDDPDDTDTLRLRVLPAVTGAEKGSYGRRGWGMALIGVAGLGGLLGALRRTRLLGLLLLLLAGTGFLAFSQTTRYTVELVSAPPRAGTLLGSGTYKAGELVQVSALPNRGFEFVGWFENDEEISSDPILEFTADRHRRLVARFRPILDFLGLTGGSQGKLALTPTTALESLRFEIRSRYQFGFNPWEFRGLAVFAGGEWREAQGHFTGSWDKARFGGGLMFNPTGPAYRSAYALLSLPWEDLRFSFRVTHYPSYGLPPSPALLSYLSVSFPDISFTLRFEEKEALTFKDATLSLFQLGLCCDIRLQGTLIFGKEGFSYLRLAALEIPLGCCGASADLAVTFTVDTKAVEFIPRFLPYCDPCLTLYGDVLWQQEIGQLQGLALYGYKIRCCFGARCCPPGPGGYVEFLTAFDPSRVPGGFKEGEFEYLKLGFCGPACCGGTYRLDLAIFFRPGGGLFGVSRVLAQGSVPLTPGLALEPRLELPLQGDAVLSLSWNWRF